MNREIKFRVWDIPLKKWCYGYGQSRLDDHNLTICFDGRLINGFGGPTNQDRFIIQQYTGIKAFNKEVYEGDIVRLIEGTKCGIVEYRNASFGVNFMGYILPLTMSADFEIVGNINENKELLDK